MAMREEPPWDLLLCQQERDNAQLIKGWVVRNSVKKPATMTESREDKLQNVSGWRDGEHTV